MSGSGNILLPGQNPDIKPQLIGTLLSALFYGLVISLVVHSLESLILTAKRTYSNRIRWLLIAYVVVMFLLSSSAFVQVAVYIMRAIFQGVDSSSHQLVEINEPLILPFTVWGADSLMLWRCVILYGNTMQMRRAILYCVLGLLSLVSLGSGVLYYATPDIPIFMKTSGHIPTMINVSVTTFVNTMLACLIVGRLISHQKNMRRALGPQYGSPYMKLIVMLVESCSFIVINGLVYLLLFVANNKRTDNGCIIPLLVLPHVCVISPLLIVYGVGKGKALHKSTPPCIITPNLGENDLVSRPIRFRDPSSTSQISQQEHDAEKEEKPIQDSRCPISTAPSISTGWDSSGDKQREKGA